VTENLPTSDLFIAHEMLRISCAILLLVYAKIGLQFAKRAEFIIIVVELYYITKGECDVQTCLFLMPSSFRFPWMLVFLPFFCIILGTFIASHGPTFL